LAITWNLRLARTPFSIDVCFDSILRNIHGRDPCNPLTSIRPRSDSPSSPSAWPSKKLSKALADTNGSQAGSWLDEVEELALLRAKGRLAEAQQHDAAAAAIAVVEAIFARLRSGYSNT
jgi:hypothetical protein